MKMQTKNMDYVTIKDFSELVGITPDALRYYDRRGVFFPSKRGVEFENKYRFYSPMQITTINMIRVLTEIGVPLETIRDFEDDRTPDKLMKLLSKNKDILSDKLRFLQDSYSLTSTYIELLNSGICATEDEVYASEMPEKQIILGDVTDFEGSSDFYGEFARFCSAEHEPKLNISYPIGGYWGSMDAFLHEPSRPIRFFSLDPRGYQRKDAGLYLIGYTRGYYGQTNDLPERMAAFAKKNGLVFSGPVYNIYLFDELSVADPEQYLLQACAAVKETRRVPSRRSYNP